MEDNSIINAKVQEIPGTAQIRKIGSYMSSTELLELCATLAEDGLYKKLWSVLSRVYSESKGFNKEPADGMSPLLDRILSSDAPCELKLQTFTSFLFPDTLLPDISVIKSWIADCDRKRKNIAAYFISDYHLSAELFKEIVSDEELMAAVIAVLKEDDLLALYTAIFENEKKEVITGAIRLFAGTRRKMKYSDYERIGRLTELAFECKEVFFTSKLLFCTAFSVPAECVRSVEKLDKILKISINYEEKITKDFVKKYGIDFDCSDKAICGYYLGNKKSANQKNLVVKFASHIVRINDERDRRYLLRGAFKRGGYFRMYAGCMQDGFIDPEKMKRFHYSDEDVKWCSHLPGLEGSQKNNNQEDM